MVELAEIRGLATIYRKLVGARIRADWQYRTAFVLFGVSQFLAGFLDFAAIAILFTNVDQLAGWTVAEVAFLYGVAGVAFTLGDVFVSQVERAGFHIKQGSFDQFLVRPLGPLFQLCCQEFALRRVGKVVQAVVVLLVAMAALDVQWNPARVAALPVIVAAGFVIFSGIWVVTSSVAFWTVDTQEVANSFTYGGNFVAQYPIEIFSGWLRRLVTLVPIAFVSYFPALWVLGRDDGFGAPTWFSFASPGIALAVALLAAVVWRSGVRHYRSTGS